ncbi:hypothetical protein VTK73DRAFT_8854 [Phialemonium thermophilum]|uniref:Uncharacterized protein n=1 Tax=Phialemonium thermophilum TaxID=223376 RepID=A0ABR3W5Y5_9PEZI
MTSSSGLWRAVGLAVAALVLRIVSAQDEGCSSTGLDYTNGGSYLIDATSEDNFTFTSLFDGCDYTWITPILIGPDDTQYNCTDIETQPDDSEQISECDITFADMPAGNWSIILQAPDLDFAVERDFNISRGETEVVTVTVVPTVVVGVTSTPPASTVTNDITETALLYQDPDTVYEDCDVATQTLIHAS